jgi:hypothetical protein
VDAFTRVKIRPRIVRETGGTTNVMDPADTVPAPIIAERPLRLLWRLEELKGDLEGWKSKRGKSREISN